MASAVRKYYPNMDMEVSTDSLCMHANVGAEVHITLTPELKVKRAAGEGSILFLVFRSQD